MRASLIAPVVLLAALPFAGMAQEIPKYKVSGVVMDQAGRPLANAEIGMYMTRYEGKTTIVNAIKTGADGRFSGEMQIYQLPTTLLAVDEQRLLGTIVEVTKESVGEPMKVVLKPMAKVRPNLKMKRGQMPDDLSLNFGLREPRGMVAASAGSDEIVLPEGKYVMSLFSFGAKPTSVEFDVKSGQAFTIPLLELEPSPLAENAGKTAMPLTFEHARGVSKDFKLSDLKGKWVLLEFWGHW